MTTRTALACPEPPDRARWRGGILADFHATWCAATSSSAGSCSGECRRIAAVGNLLLEAVLPHGQDKPEATVVDPATGHRIRIDATTALQLANAIADLSPRGVAPPVHWLRRPPLS